jgi:hypothetical protein
MRDSYDFLKGCREGNPASEGVAEDSLDELLFRPLTKDRRSSFLAGGCRFRWKILD